jgi:tetratricopeptide (TPR) repeat protein
LSITEPEQRPAFQVIRHEIVLLIVIAAAAVPLYLFTRRMAAVNRHRNAAIAVDLYRRAQRQLANHEPGRALDSLRRAVTNDRNNTRFAFAFAQALAAAGHDDEARAALLRLREAAPESPEINLELARLSARQRDTPQAIRYYHHALYGLWTGDRAEQRRQQVRIELIRLLLDGGDPSRALAELLSMSAEVPHTSPAQLELARLFAAAGDPGRAREHFVRASGLDPHSFAALQGAGEASFRLGDYRAAAQNLKQALELEPGSTQVADLLETATLVESRDPLKEHLSRGEQFHRLTLDLEQAARRVADCIETEQGQGAFLPSGLEPLRNEVESMRATIREGALGRDPDLRHAAADLVFRVEETTSATCHTPAPFDRALLLIGRRHTGGEP